MVGMHQRPIVQRPGLGQEDGIRRRIVVAEFVACLILRRRVLVTDAQVERESRADFPVVLQISELHPLPQFGHQQIGYGDLARRAEHEIGQIVNGRGSGAFGTAERAGVGVQTVKRIRVLILRVDNLKFVPRLQRMPRGDLGKADARVENGRILPLRIGGEPPELGEAANRLGIQTTIHARIGGIARNPVGRQQIGASAQHRSLPTPHPRHAESRLQNARRTQHERIGSRHALIERSLVSIAVAARRPGIVPGSKRLSLRWLMRTKLLSRLFQ